MRLTPTVLMTHMCSPHSLCLLCEYKPDNQIGVAGAKALVPALKQMTQMTTLQLSGKYRMARTHYGLLYKSEYERVRVLGNGCVADWVVSLVCVSVLVYYVRMYECIVLVFAYVVLVTMVVGVGGCRDGNSGVTDH